MSWEEEEKERGWTRREWVKLSITAGTLGTIGGLGGLVTGQILPPPVKFNGEIREEIVYTKWPTPDPRAWWNPRQGQPVRVSHFGEWQGATGVWRGLFVEGRWVPGTGFPCLIIRIKREAQYFEFPSEEGLPVPLPEGFSLFFDDPDLDPDNGGTRIVVLFDRCVHLCCFPGWHMVTDPKPGRDYDAYGADPPTWQQFGQDPVYCVCHASQYDPMLLIVDVNPKNRRRYVGAQRVHGPATRALPLIPVRVQGEVLVGGMPDPAWYIYC